MGSDRSSCHKEKNTSSWHLLDNTYIHLLANTYIQLLANTYIHLLYKTYIHLLDNTYIHLLDNTYIHLIQMYTTVNMFITVELKESTRVRSRLQTMFSI